MLLERKDIYENTFTNKNNFTLLSVQSIYENVIVAVTNPSIILDYNVGSIFYLPSDFVLSSNFSISITNIPTDVTKTYSVTLVYNQASTLYYSNLCKVTDTAGAFILGNASTFLSPRFNGAVTIVSSPNLIYQNYNIISIASAGGVYTRYVVSSVNSCS